MKAPVDKVQTGGFGDPNGMPGKGDPNHATNVNRLGLASTTRRRRIWQRHRRQERYCRHGCQHGIWQRNCHASNRRRREKRRRGSEWFWRRRGGYRSAEKETQAGGPPDTGIIVQDKPRPEYTAEARSLKIEGDVVLDLIFLANGNIQINRVVSGLGHGLDEAAERAAQQIKFKPAQRDHEPVVTQMIVKGLCD